MSLKFFSLTVPVKPKALAGAEMVVRYTLDLFSRIDMNNVQKYVSDRCSSVLITVQTADTKLSTHS